MRRLSVALASLLLATSMLTMAPSVALAGTQGSCPTSDTTRALYWENGTGDSSDGNDNLWQCGNSPDFNNIAHTLAGHCKTVEWGFGDHWNDCISSVTVYLPSNYDLCLFPDANYSPSFSYWRIAGPRSGSRINLTGYWNDTISSALFLPHAYACTIA